VLNDYVGNRLSLRFPFEMKVKLKGRKFKETQYTTSNISATGVFIPTNSAPELGLAVDIKLYLPKTKRALSVKGKILRIKWAGNFKHIEGFAVEFKKIDRPSEDKLLNFLNKVGRGDI